MAQSFILKNFFNDFDSRSSCPQFPSLVLEQSLIFQCDVPSRNDDPAKKQSYEENEANKRAQKHHEVFPRRRRDDCLVQLGQTLRLWCNLKQLNFFPWISLMRIQQLSLSTYQSCVVEHLDSLSEFLSAVILESFRLRFVVHDYLKTFQFCNE
jgi:hypothetical protein